MTAFKVSSSLAARRWSLSAIRSVDCYLLVMSCFLVYGTGRARFHTVLLRRAALSCNNAANIVNTTCTINADAANSDSRSKYLDIFDSGTSDITHTPPAPRSNTSSNDDGRNSSKHPDTFVSNTDACTHSQHHHMRQQVRTRVHPHAPLDASQQVPPVAAPQLHKLEEPPPTRPMDTIHWPTTTQHDAVTRHDRGRGHTGVLEAQFSDSCKWPRPSLTVNAPCQPKGTQPHVGLTGR